ncbi:hypothetical protein [Tuwongella immobilis]|uniref:Uncharacterized protein n=1 Tax=Tuwongella immobilis TaxID=692036 RepID=A0A6C2YHU6_9BACT|nr:hypothetical protein [Tuwongella immobilis]VIP01100.1 unnamed protein product [Tuwongella immobilis]VTR97625.1 unnamed protein product [Tuwongella immobilis]
MPSRWIVGAILTFWLASAGWLFWREIGARYFLEQPPSLSTDIGDEATTAAPETLWSLHRLEKDGSLKEIGRAATKLQYFPEDDTFSLIGRMYQVKLEYPLLGFGTLEVQIPDLNTGNRVTRAGIIRETAAQGKMAIALNLGGVTLPPMQFEADLHGKVVDTTIAWKILVRSKDGAFGKWEIQPEIPPTAVPSGSVINPLQPLNRIRDLRAGQSWEQSLIDPIADAMQAAVPQLIQEMSKSSGVKPNQLPKIDLPIATRPILRARVLSEQRDLLWQGVTDRCRIIEYTAGEELVGRTWVAVENDLVMRQEAFQAGESLIMQREDPSRSELKK